MNKIVLALVALTFIATVVFASDSDIEMAPKDVVESLYTYCGSLQTTETIDKKVLLKCINDDLVTNEYRTFSTIEAIEAYIAESSEDN